MREGPTRSKVEMARDAAIVMNTDELHLETKHAVLRDVAWRWTTFHGKYEGCPYWTPAARQQFAARGINGLRHEHAVPKILVIKRLLGLASPDVKNVDETDVYQTCERFLIGVVITQEEDRILSKSFFKKMPPEFDDPASPHYQDPWLRYRKCRIAVVDATGRLVIEA